MDFLANHIVNRHFDIPRFRKGVSDICIGRKWIGKDAGVDIGFPFSGEAPDLGAIETDYLTSSIFLTENTNEIIGLQQNCCSPGYRYNKTRYAPE